MTAGDPGVHIRAATVPQCRLADTDAAACRLEDCLPVSQRQHWCIWSRGGYSSAVAVDGRFSAFCPSTGDGGASVWEDFASVAIAPTSATMSAPAAPGGTAFVSRPCLSVRSRVTMHAHRQTFMARSLATYYTWTRDQSTKEVGCGVTGGAGGFPRPGAHPKESDLRAQGGPLGQGATFYPLYPRMRPPRPRAPSRDVMVQANNYFE